MPIHRLFPVLVLLLFITFSQKTYACGYSFIGECPTGIHLRINNTLDSFNLTDCSFGKSFDGLDLGTIQSLHLARATAITWESCTNNVASVALYYRVYQQGQPSGNWALLNLQEDYNTLVGPYTTRYRSQFANNSLTSGLTVGATYTLEIYFAAQIDTIGDDFIPETTLFQNNNGNNYKLSFEFGGASAPPFTVVATHKSDEKCYGDSTGIAGVTVYGNQNNLFYQWSNVNNNFHTLYELGAGTYTVTVSGVNGYTQSQTMTVLQPDPINIAFLDVQPVICGNTPGSASAVVSGGTAPYSYLWETGEPDSVAAIPLPGTWGLSITDASGCSASAVVQVSGNTTLQQTLSTFICAGSSYTLDGHVFNTAGTYEVFVGGNGNCDTLFSLTINVLDPATALMELPANADLTCNSPSITLCATNVPATSFLWKRDDMTLSSSACVVINASAAYTVFATTQQAGQSCTASKMIVVNSYLLAPQVQVSGVATYQDCTGTAAGIILTATTNAVAPSFSWSLAGNTISTADTCYIEVSNPLNFTPPAILVTDVYGCLGTASSINIVVNPANTPVAVETLTHASGPNAADGSVQLSVSGGESPYSVQWANGSTGNTLSGLLPGNYCYTLSDAAGCTTADCVEISFTNSTDNAWATAEMRMYPNPLKAGNPLYLLLPETNVPLSVSMELFNLQGQTIWREHHEVIGALLSVPLPGSISPGQYMIRIKSGLYERFRFLTVL